MIAQLKVAAAKAGMEVVVALFGTVMTAQPPTAVGGPHIGFSVTKPYLSNFAPPGCTHGARIGAVFAGTGGPLTTALETPEQGSEWANTCLETFASQGCIAHHEHLEVSAAGGERHASLLAFAQATYIKHIHCEQAWPPHWCFSHVTDS
jgi:hypothetical protein